jgi:DNA-binding NtrC family response regulator
VIEHRSFEDGSPAHGLIGDSPQLQGVLRIIRKLSNDTSPVLITGESGTGKELVARAVHEGSPLKGKKLVPVDSATLVGSLMESELFGHVKGAFTGAIDNKLGLVRTAVGGTLFLDEIGELSPETQAKLLRLLQEGEMRPIGGTEPIRVDVRVVAATNRNLEAAVRDGKFREDLYYRLKVITIRVPALRNRQMDILPLAHHFVAKYSLTTVTLSEAVETRLIEYSWPGNVRELENTIRQIVVLNSNPLVEIKDLPTNLRNAMERGGAANGHSVDILPLEELERRHIMHAVDSAKGDITHAATVLGISKATIRRKLKRYEDQGRAFGDPQGLLPF